MKTIFAIDPGPELSAFVAYDGSKPVWFDKIENRDLLKNIESRRGLIGCETLIIEQIAAMGMAVGAEVFETCFWSGRFAQAWSGEFDRVKRNQVKMHLCGNMRAKDANIRQAIIDKFGGKDRGIGKKKTPGPLYGMSGDCWAALAVAITWWETCRNSALPAGDLRAACP